MTYSRLRFLPLEVPGYGYGDDSGGGGEGSGDDEGRGEGRGERCDSTPLPRSNLPYRLLKFTDVRDPRQWRLYEKVTEGGDGRRRRRRSIEEGRGGESSGIGG